MTFKDYLLESKNLDNIWFHGDQQKREHFCDQKMDRVPFMEEPNANGPGIYCTKDYNQAFGYAEPNGYVYMVKIDPKAGYVIKKRDKAVNHKEFMFDLIKKAQIYNPESVYYGVTDYGIEIINVEDVTDNHIKLIINKYFSNNKLIDAAVAIYKEFWGRDANAWVNAMVELGMLGFIKKQPDTYHLIVYNCKAIEILKEEKYRKLK
jgi:hypothetical protein